MNAKKMVVQVMKKNHVGIDISKEKCQRQENIKCFQQMNNTQEVLNVKVRLFFYWAIISTRLKAINPTFLSDSGPSIRHLQTLLLLGDILIQVLDQRAGHYKNDKRVFPISEN